MGVWLDELSEVVTGAALSLVVSELRLEETELVTLGTKEAELEFGEPPQLVKANPSKATGNNNLVFINFPSGPSIAGFVTIKPKEKCQSFSFAIKQSPLLFFSFRLYTSRMQPKAITVQSLYADFASKKDITKSNPVYLEGWVRTNRDNGSIGFIELNDGTCFKAIQIVYDSAIGDYAKVAHILTGAAIAVKGEIRLTPAMKQPFEVHASAITILGDVDPDYPLQKKFHTMEYLRDIAYLRPRTNTFTALYRVRSVLAMAIHEFFQGKGFIYVHTPEITANDAEGAGQVFTVTTDAKDPINDFYGRRASLTVSGQLHVEAFAMAFRDVYTFGPTFRAEKSNTPRHASEFWMIEPEIAFADLDDDMALMEETIKFCIRYVLDHCPDEMAFFNTFIDKGLLEKLNHVLNTPFTHMEYTEGIKLLQEAVKNGHKFDNSNIEWGMDLQSEHERYLTEEIVKGPMFLIDYPKEIKAFYMRENDDGKTVAACDCLVPGEGEIIGGSQREERYDVLKAKMDKIGNTKGLEWYLNLRKYGGCIHSGFGIGFDRLLMYITGVANIRDTEPYPRTSSNLKY
jgi:asparaginyl-tRNA synthetase